MDRIGPKAAVICSDVIRAICVFVMPWITHSMLLFVPVFVVSVAAPFFDASMNPIITALTSKESRHRVNSIRSTINSSAMFIGPMLGGVLVAHSVRLPFVVEFISFLASAVLWGFIRIPRKASATPKKKIPVRVILSDIDIGYRYILRQKIIRNIVLLIVFLMLGGSAIDSYEVLFVTKALHLGPTGYGIVVSVSGAGFVIGGFLNSMIGKRVSPFILISLGAFVIVISNFIYSFSFGLFTVTVSLILLGCAIISMSTSAVTLQQEIIPVEMQGRITSLQNVIPQISATISVTVAGICLVHFSVRSVFIVEACVMLLTLVPAFSVFRLRHSNLQDSLSVNS